MSEVARQLNHMFDVESNTTRPELSDMSDPNDTSSTFSNVSEYRTVKDASFLSQASQNRNEWHDEDQLDNLPK